MCTMSTHSTRTQPATQTTRIDCSPTITYVDCKESLDLDKYLMNEAGAAFSLPQLMELAGLSVASAVYELFGSAKDVGILILAGPGNNGGDALVASRHLKHFGFSNISVLYPVQADRRRFKNLVTQLEQNEVAVSESFDNLAASLKRTAGKDFLGSGAWLARHFDVILDGLFGVGFTPPMRPAFEDIVKAVNESSVPTICIDVPSGWTSGPDKETASPLPSQIVNVHALISLSLPKECAIYIRPKHHFLGGRFIPARVAKQRGYQLPMYPNTAQIVSLDGYLLVPQARECLEPSS